MKRSQIKMGESIAVLLIFFVLVVMGIVFWYRYSVSTVKLRAEEDLFSRAIKNAQTVTFLSELQCTKQEVIKFSCFDIYKIEGMEKIVQNEDASLYYYDVFGFSNITVVELYPSEQSWTIYDKPGNYSGYVTTQTPAAIYDPIKDEYGFGYLTVSVYEQRR